MKMSQKTKFYLYTTFIAVLLIGISRYSFEGQGMEVIVNFIVGVYIGSLLTYSIFGGKNG